MLYNHVADNYIFVNSSQMFISEPFTINICEVLLV